MTPNPFIVGVFANGAEWTDEAARFARHLSLPLLTAAPEAAHLRFDGGRLALMPGNGMGPVLVDFAGGSLGHRQRFGGGRGQTIARAMGLKGGANPRVLDATAGLGRDAFVLASLGCPVRMLERNPVIAALLEDGLRRACQDPGLAQWIGQRLQLVAGDARTLLPMIGVDDVPDVVYLDPMYPQRNNSALAKKEMRVFRQLLGDDPDAPELLALARHTARKRVVVKRPKQAAPLAGVQPSLSIGSRNTRYDIYLKI